MPLKTLFSAVSGSSGYERQSWGMSGTDANSILQKLTAGKAFSA